MSRPSSQPLDAIDNTWMCIAQNLAIILNIIIFLKLLSMSCVIIVQPIKWLSQPILSHPKSSTMALGMVYQLWDHRSTGLVDQYTTITHLLPSCLKASVGRWKGMIKWSKLYLCTHNTYTRHVHSGRISRGRLCRVVQRMRKARIQNCISRGQMSV